MTFLPAIPISTATICASMSCWWRPGAGRCILSMHGGLPPDSRTFLMTIKRKSKSHLKIAIQMDPLERFIRPSILRFIFAHAAAKGGYELFHYDSQHLRLETRDRNVRVTAKGHALKFKKARRKTASITAPSKFAISPVSTLSSCGRIRLSISPISRPHMRSSISGIKCGSSTIRWRYATHRKNCRARIFHN